LTEVVRRWLDDEPAQRLWFAAQAMTDELSQRTRTGAGPLASALANEELAHCYAAVNRARESLRGPLRADLLLVELLAQWR
jgi:DNA polymerase-3 subunit delta'